MDTKRIITNEDAKAFFNSTLNSIEDGIGIAVYNKANQTILFDFNATLLLSFNGVYADTLYSIDDKKIYDDLGSVFLLSIKDPITPKSSFRIEKETSMGLRHFEIKLEENPKEVILYILCYEVLVSTEETLSLISNVTGAGKSMFIGNTWWIDYDYHANHFYQSDNGPKILGIPIQKDKLYSTRKFSAVRENARKVSPYFEECISVEAANYEQVRENKSDFFGGRTPALTAKGDTVWIEAYGKCLLRYPDGTPRFFIAIDLYLSDITENLNQLNIINSLINTGLINSKVGVWYHQKHFTEGRYFFTKSFENIMNLDNDVGRDLLNGFNSYTKTGEILRSYYQGIIELFPEYEPMINNFFETHNKLFGGEIDKYTVTLPNFTDKDNPMWIEVRGTAVERDEFGELVLFVGVNVDVTESYLREQELKQLKLQNERLQLAEKLAVKAGNVVVWYQDTTLLKEMKYIFGNEAFYNKLGIKRTKDGLISVSDIMSSMVKGSTSEKHSRRNVTNNLLNIYKNKTTDFHDVISKHRHLATGEIVYFSNSVEIEEMDDEGNITLIGGIMVDITENRKREEKIRFLANHDILSNLYNRNYFEQYIQNELPSKYGVCIFDLDGLKLINDAFGHLEGDKIIKVIARLLEETFKENLFIARIGGDEFVVLLSSTSVDHITMLLNDFDNRIAKYNKTSTIEINVSRAGIIIYDKNESFEKAFAAVENRMYKRKLNNRSSRKSKVLESILETLNQKTEETKDHSDRLGTMAVLTMKELGMSREAEIEDILLLAKVHDIGKITIPDNILNKPSKLTKEEFEIIKKHCEAGYKIIKNITDSDHVSSGVLSHHEKYDGSGYPQGLAGINIPIYARIISVVDAFDAMTSVRVYKDARTPKDAIEELLLCSGSHFDPKIVEAFIKAYNKHIINK